MDFMTLDSEGARPPGISQDLAYACFIPPGIVTLISALATLTSVSNDLAALVWLFLLLPSTLVTLASVPTGIYLSIVHRRDIILLLLSTLTILVAVVGATEGVPVAFSNATEWVYLVLVTILEASWFLIRRPRVYASWRARSA